MPENLPPVVDLKNKRKDYPSSPLSKYTNSTNQKILSDPEKRVADFDNSFLSAVDAMSRVVKLRPEITEKRTTPETDERDQVDFAHTVMAEESLREHANDLAAELGISANEAMVAAAAVLDSAADRPGATVESIQTCMTLLKDPVPGMSGKDVPEDRRDEYGVTTNIRSVLAELKLDSAATWLKLQKIYGDEGAQLGTKISEFISSKPIEDQPNYELMFAKIFLWKRRMDKIAERNEELKSIGKEEFFVLLERILNSLESGNIKLPVADNLS